jgi:hypothetical protein
MQVHFSFCIYYLMAHKLQIPGLNLTMKVFMPLEEMKSLISENSTYLSKDANFVTSAERHTSSATGILDNVHAITQDLLPLLITLENHTRTMAHLVRLSTRSNCHTSMHQSACQSAQADQVTVELEEVQNTIIGRADEAEEEGQGIIDLTKLLVHRIDAAVASSDNLVSDLKQEVAQWKHSNSAYVTFLIQLQTAIANAGLISSSGVLDRDVSPTSV